MGIATELIKKIIDYIHTHYSNQPIDISAQLYLKNFYAKFGFKTVGEQYDEAGIPHIKMIAPAFLKCSL